MAIASLMSAIAFDDAAHAQAIEIAPITIELLAGRLATTLTVTNHSNTQATLQVRPFSWDQTGGANHLSATQDLLVSPPFTTVGAGESQTIRVVLRKPATVKEDSYRLLVDDLPPTAEAGSVRVALRLSLPVFAQPLLIVKPSLHWSMSMTTPTHGLLTIVNDGTRHARISNIRLMSPGIMFTVPEDSLAYVLPYSSVSLPVTFTGSLTNQVLVRVAAETDKGKVQADVHVSPNP